MPKVEASLGYILRLFEPKDKNKNVHYLKHYFLQNIFILWAHKSHLKTLNEQNNVILKIPYAFFINMYFTMAGRNPFHLLVIELYFFVCMCVHQVHLFL